MTQLFSIESNDTVLKQMSTPTRNGKNCSKKQPFNSSILYPKCAKHALSSLLMCPLTSPGAHSPVKPASSIEFNKTIEALDSNMDNAEGVNSDAVILINGINNKCILDKL